MTIFYSKQISRLSRNLGLFISGVCSSSEWSGFSHDESPSRVQRVHLREVFAPLDMRRFYSVIQFTVSRLRVVEK